MKNTCSPVLEWLHATQRHISATWRLRAAGGAVLTILALAMPAQAVIETGGDISEVAIEQQNGIVFQDTNGVALNEPLSLCKTYKWTVARIRLYVNPPTNGAYAQTLPYAVALAQRAKAQGMKILLDIHYTDADPVNYHDLPAAWQGQTYSQLQTTVKNYTINVMNTFKSAGVLPAFVQIGNEVGDGSFFPVGGPISFTNGIPGPPQIWSQFIGLVKAGISGVKAVSSTPKIMIHIPGGPWAGWCTEYFDAFNSQGVNYDLIGLSYYPYTTGSSATDLSAIKATLDAMHNRYSGKKLWIAEFSYDWNWGITSGTNVYWNDPAGQYWISHDLCNLVSSYSDGGGVCYWGCFYVDNPNLGTDSWAGKALFDSTWYSPDGGNTWVSNPYHKMLPAFGAF